MARRVLGIWVLRVKNKPEQDKTLLRICFHCYFNKFLVFFLLLLLFFQKCVQHTVSNRMFTKVICSCYLEFWLLLYSSYDWV